MDLGLKGKIAIVTGGAVGIGRGIVECLAREGATVVIVDLNMEASKRLADQVGNKSIAIKVDLTQETDVDNAVKTTLDKFGKIDILVNNAGVSRNIKFVDINPEEWDRVFNVNVKGLYLITRAILLHMMQR